MNPYAQRLQEGLRASGVEPADVERLVRAVDGLAPTARRDVERLDGLVGYLAGFGPRPGLGRGDVRWLTGLVGALAPPEAFSELDVRLLDLVADPAVWRWSSKGRVQGACVPLGARAAELVLEEPAAPRFDGLQAALLEVSQGRRDLVPVVLGARPAAVHVDGRSTSLGREIVRRVEDGAWPWWSELFGRRGVVAVAEALAIEAPGRLEVEAERLEEVAGPALAPQLVGPFLLAQTEALRTRAVRLAQSIDSAPAQLALARILSRRGDADPQLGEAFCWAERALIEARRTSATSGLAVEAAAVLLAADAARGRAEVCALARSLETEPDRGALAAAAVSAPPAIAVEVWSALALRAAEVGVGAAAAREISAHLARLPRGEDAPPALDALELLGHAKKTVRDVAAAALRPAVAGELEHMQTRLPSALARERRALVDVLAQTPGPVAKGILQELAQADRAKAVREAADLVLLGLGGGAAAPAEAPASPADTADEHAAAVAQTEALLARMQRHLAKPVRPWLDEAELPALLGPDGARLPADYARLLLRLASREKGPRLPEAARSVLATVEPESRRAFGDALLGQFLARGATATDKFCLVLALAASGDGALVALLPLVPKWPKSRRAKIAEFTLEAIGASDAPLADVALDGLARSLRAPYPKVAAVARRGLAARASAAGRARLEHVIEATPRYGFEGRLAEVAVDRRRLRVGVDITGELRLRYSDGKTLKSLPKALPASVRAPLASFAATRKWRLEGLARWVEDLLFEGRALRGDRWMQAFLHDALRFVSVPRQVWVHSTAEGEVAFRGLEDGTLVDVQGEPIAAPREGVVRLLHPTVDGADQIEAWGDHFEGFRVSPLVAQLDRPTHLLPAAHSGARFDPHFEGRPCEAFDRLRAARRLGWRVEGLYAGADPKFTKAFVGPRVVTLRVDGGGAYALGFDVTDEDGRPHPLGTVPPPLYAQIIAELEAVVGAAP